MANVDDPKIVEAYNDVRDDKNATTWVLLDYEVSGVSLSLLSYTRYALCACLYRARPGGLGP
jgi:hypothetical protein